MSLVLPTKSWMTTIFEQTPPVYPLAVDVNESNEEVIY